VSRTRQVTPPDPTRSPTRTRSASAVGAARDDLDPPRRRRVAPTGLGDRTAAPGEGRRSAPTSGGAGRRGRAPQGPPVIGAGSPCWTRTRSRGGRRPRRSAAHRGRPWPRSMPRRSRWTAVAADQRLVVGAVAGQEVPVAVEQQHVGATGSASTARAPRAGASLSPSSSISSLLACPTATPTAKLRTRTSRCSRSAGEDLRVAQLVHPPVARQDHRPTLTGPAQAPHPTSSTPATTAPVPVGRSRAPRGRGCGSPSPGGGRGGGVGHRAGTVPGGRGATLPGGRARPRGSTGRPSAPSGTPRSPTAEAPATAETGRTA
jgi:hypothetical protein